MPNLVYLVVTTIILIIGVALITWGTPIGIISPYLLPAIWIGWITILITIIVTVWYYFYVVSGKRRNISKGVEIFLLSMCVLIMLLCITVGVLALLVNAAIVANNTTLITTTTTTGVVVTRGIGSLVLWGGILCLIAAIGPIITFFLVRSAQKVVVVEEERTALLATEVDPLLVARLEYLESKLKSDRDKSDVRFALSNYLKDPNRYATQAKYISGIYCDNPDMNCPSGYNRDLVQQLESARASVSTRDPLFAAKIANAIDTYKRRPSPDNELLAQTLLSSFSSNAQPSTQVIVSPPAPTMVRMYPTSPAPPASLAPQSLPAPQFSPAPLAPPTSIIQTTIPSQNLTTTSISTIPTMIPTQSMASSMQVQMSSRIDPNILNSLNYIKDNVSDSERNKITQMIADYASSPDRSYERVASYINGYCACGVPCPTNITQ